MAKVCIKKGLSDGKGLHTSRWIGIGIVQLESNSLDEVADIVSSSDDI